MTAYLKIKNFTKQIKNNTILNNVNIELHKGNIYGLRGVNGSARVLFRAICGLIIPTKGEIIINDKVMYRDILFPKSMGMLIDKPGFEDEYSARENLILIASENKNLTEADVDRALRIVGIDIDDDIKYERYSLFKKRKLGLAKVLMKDPELILLDEPIKQLNEYEANSIIEILVKQKQSGKLILISGKDRSILEKLSDKIFDIEVGKMKFAV